MDKEKHMVRKIKLVTSVITTYLFLSILTIIIWIALNPPTPCTALSFTLAGSSTWAIGTKGGGQTSTSPGSPTTWTVTNDTSPAVPENITIQVTGATWTSASSAWTTSATAGSNIYVLTLKSPGDTVMGTTATTLASGLVGGGQKGFGLAFTTPTAGEQGDHTLTITLTAMVASCGDISTVTHTAGTVAPEAKTVTYGTVTSSLSGASKCWITQNLGATNQATSATDNTEASAGWYWQFNRKQGYKHDGTTPIPAWTITSINEVNDWQAANDPCTLLLGAGWRIPTYTEWYNADANGAWDCMVTYVDGYGNTHNGTYSSVLALHAAGSLYGSGGALSSRGSTGYCWSSSQSSSTAGYNLLFYSSYSYVSSLNKAYGFSVRCLKD